MWERKQARHKQHVLLLKSIFFCARFPLPLRQLRPLLHTPHETRALPSLFAENRVKKRRRSEKDVSTDKSRVFRLFSHVCGRGFGRATARRSIVRHCCGTGCATQRHVGGGRQSAAGPESRRREEGEGKVFPTGAQFNESVSKERKRKESRERKGPYTLPDGPRAPLLGVL